MLFLCCALLYANALRMLRGKDGKMYYTDQPGDYESSIAGANVKPIAAKSQLTKARLPTNGKKSSGEKNSGRGDDASTINDDIEE
jgi:hypothetical protein